MLIACDASQLEWRTAVELSKDQTGLTEIRDKQDTHSLNQRAFELPSRLIAKIYLFRTIFRGSGWAFAHDPDFSHVSSDPKFWDRVNEKFYGKYHELDAKHNEWAELVVRGLPIVGPLGRSWSINMAIDKRTKELKIPWTTLSNYPVQGTGADVMALARVTAYRRIKKLNIPCKFITTVHDSIVTDSQEKYIQPITEVFAEVFNDLPANIKKVFKYEWETPLDCECKYGMNMLDMEKA